MVSPSAKASCWEGSAAKGMPRVRHSRVCRSIASGSLAPMTHEVEAPDPVGHRLSSIWRASRHRAGVEGGDLRHVVVGGADEPRSVPGLGDVHGLAVHAVALEPAAVVGEVLTDRSHEDRALPEVGHAEGDVGGDAAAADLQVLGQEGERDLVELLDDEGVGEAALEGHQVVGGNGSGDGNAHACNLPSRAGSAAGRRGPADRAGHLPRPVLLMPVPASVTPWYRRVRPRTGPTVRG